VRSPWTFSRSFGVSPTPPDPRFEVTAGVEAIDQAGTASDLWLGVATASSTRLRPLLFAT
jgi:hypothetical protein